MTGKTTTRREFLLKAAQGTAMAATGGLLWVYLLRQEARAHPYALRPPGALVEKDFNATCIKCGQCVNACPYDTLKLAGAGGSLPIGMPYFIPRDIPCYLCPDIPCMRACPTGALSPDLKDINDSRMGLAVIDLENCLSWKGLRCEICHRECPLKGKAISLELHPRAQSKHAMFYPIVNSDFCTGCGICEKACPTAEAAIRILPHGMVQGRIGEHYRLGWTFDTEISQDFKPAETAPPAVQETTVPDKAPGVDYLNEGEP
ncbi:MAG TPA: ferredoxin-type protein NapG [Thiobacillaceae bacterium]|nr:ferredoxin-type protein NapG [Thiobacillaceae bacterium]HNU65144.1 ferredoxin-type protein NapG [Thiobacillaceae bacterium]